MRTKFTGGNHVKGSTRNQKRPLMQFYAYRPTEAGQRPPDDATGVASLFKLRTWSGAKCRARRLYGWNAVVYECPAFYDESTWIKVCGKVSE